MDIPKGYLQCDKCKDYFSPYTIKRHRRTCDGVTGNIYLNSNHGKIYADLQQPDGMYKCPYCGKLYNNYGIGGHIWRSHGEGKNFKNDPNRGYRDGTRVPWNKGLTKETDDRVRKYSDTLHEVLSGRLGRKFTDEQKANHSRIMREVTKGKGRFHVHKDAESEPERNFHQILQRFDLPYLVIHNYSPKEYSKKYEMDFAIVERKIYFEINGGQHYNSDGTFKDYHLQRKMYIESYGWTQIDVDWKLCSDEAKIRDIITSALGDFPYTDDIHPIIEGRRCATITG